MNTEQLARKLKKEFEEILDIRISIEKSRSLIDATFDKIGDIIRDDEKVSIIGFGEFESVQRSERKTKHPVTGDIIPVPARKSPKFKPSKVLKDKVDNKL